MKRTAIFTLVFALIGTTLMAQHAEKEVSEAVELLKKGLLDGDRAILDKITSADLSYGHSSGKIEDKTAFVESYASGKSDFVTLDFAEQTITLKDNVAIVRHKLSGDTNDGGKPGRANIGVILVWIKEGNAWKLVARQAFKLS